ncbi:unnamed protein product [Sphacelaria rigidula]
MKDVLGDDASKTKAEMGMRSPWVDSAQSFGLLVSSLTFLPAWKTLSGAESLGGVLVPVALAIVVMCVGLTVQMVRLPVLWCDYRTKELVLAGRAGDGFCNSRLAA